jgi:hypothetical protein
VAPALAVAISNKKKVSPTSDRVPRPNADIRHRRSISPGLEPEPLVGSFSANQKTIASRELECFAVCDQFRMQNTHAPSRQLQTPKIVYLGDLIVVHMNFEQTDKTCSAG